MPPWTVVPVETFRGLDTNGGGGAVDIHDVRVDDPQRLKTRPGFLAMEPTPYTGAASMLGLVSSPALDKYFLISEDGIRIFTSAYVHQAVIAQTGLSGSAVTITNSTYFARTTGTIEKVNAAAIAGLAMVPIAGSPWCKYLTVMPTESRVVAAFAGYAGLDGEGVCFSDVGGTTWVEANSIQVQPQDSVSDDITGAANWRDLVFVFKSRSFFVFTGSSTTASGAAQFNYRAVNTGIGCTATGANSVAAGRDGVYFIGADGIYLTTGGPPELVSHPLSRWLRLENDGLFNVANSGGSFTALRTDSENLYATWTVGSLSLKTFVLSFVTGQWTVYSWVGYAALTLGLRHALLTDGSGRLYRTHDSYTSDDGFGILSRYQFPFDGFGSENEKVLREVELTGLSDSAITLGVATNWDTTDVVAQPAVTLGTAPAVTAARSRMAVRGKQFSLRIEDPSAAWDLRRVVYKLRDARTIK